MEDNVITSVVSGAGSLLSGGASLGLKGAAIGLKAGRRFSAGIGAGLGAGLGAFTGTCKTCQLSLALCKCPERQTLLGDEQPVGLY